MADLPITQYGASGHLTYRPAPADRLVPMTLGFILTQLSAWRNDPKRPKERSEKHLNSSLCDFLDWRSRGEFPMVRFKHEALQAPRRTVDVGVHGTREVTFVGTRAYTIYEPFLVIEAKRLPAPSNGREREYVTGGVDASGGIQRFKLGLHGSDVEAAVIVGYIEKESPRHWHAAINGWIVDLAFKVSDGKCVWDRGDVLGELVSDEQQGTSAAESKHDRIGRCVTKVIRLHHFWVTMPLEK